MCQPDNAGKVFLTVYPGLTATGKGNLLLFIPCKFYPGAEFDIQKVNKQ